MKERLENCVGGNMVRRMKRYTLVEIMVAIAILVMMMGFLFQFIIGAQRIWSASSRQAMAFEQAQIVFDIMGREIKEIPYSDEPGNTWPLYLWKVKDTETVKGAGYTSVDFAFVSQIKSQATTASNETNYALFPVVYYFDRSEYKLYRMVLDESVSAAGQTLAPLSMYGVDYEHISAEKKARVIGMIQALVAGMKTTSLVKKEILAEDLLEVNIEVMPAPVSAGLITSRPKAVRVTLTMFDHTQFPNYKLRKRFNPGNDAEKEALLELEQKILENAQVFSKVIFLD